MRDSKKEYITLKNAHTKRHYSHKQLLRMLPEGKS
jgi:hypothetical protein